MPQITCNRCGDSVDSHIPHLARYCFPCSIKQGEDSKLATRAVVKQIRQGLLPKAKDCLCVDCGNPAFDYDHWDYNRPLDVQPVCRSCNRKRGPAIPRIAQAA